MAILFDIDGTLIDSGGAGAVSWREAFQEGSTPRFSACAALSVSADSGSDVGEPLGMVDATAVDEAHFAPVLVGHHPIPVNLLLVHPAVVMESAGK